MAGADLDHVCPGQSKPLDPAGRKLVGEREKVLGERPCLDVPGGVLDELVIVARVEQQREFRRET